MIRSLRRSDTTAVLELSRPFLDKYGEPGFTFTDGGMREALGRYLGERSCYLRGYFQEDTLVAWLLATPGHSNHFSNVRGMSQLYYHSSLKGIAAAKVLIAMHEDYFKFAEYKGFEVAITSSVLENADVFERILKKSSWTPLSAGRLGRWTKHRSSLKTSSPRGQLGATEGVVINVSPSPPPAYSVVQQICQIQKTI